MYKFLIVLLLLALVIPALAQETPTPEPEPEPPPAAPAPIDGEAVDNFLLLALPALTVLITIIGQVLKWLLPDTLISTETLTRWVRGIAVVIFVGAALTGLDEQLLAGVSLLNQFSDPIMAILTLLFGIAGLWYGPSMVYEGSKVRAKSDDVLRPVFQVLGAKQGHDIARFDTAA